MQDKNKKPIPNKSNKNMITPQKQNWKEKSEAQSLVNKILKDKTKKRYNLKKVKQNSIEAHPGQDVKSLTQLWYQDDYIRKKIE
jgi:hypothetical protein